MNLPFLRYFNFKKERGSEGGVAVAPRPITPLDKPASERFGKTVMPNVSRVVGTDSLGSFPLAVPIGNPAPMPAPVANGPRKISLGGNGSIAVASKAESAAPVGERTIALQLADLAEHVPAGLLQTTPIDPEQRVLFKASELERGMASGRPTVLLRTIFQQVPDFFVGDVEANDPREVALPFGKVLEQFANFQVRPDQVADETVPQVETPFLKMTIEDGERHGKPVAPIPSARKTEAEVPPAAPPVEAPAVNPAPVVAENPPPIRLTLPNDEKTSATAPAVPAPIRLEAPSAPAPLPAKKISPNGMGVPATERVPASSGPPIPTPTPTPAAAGPMRIPFKVTPPSNDLQPARPATITPKPKPLPAVFATEGPRISLPLRVVLRRISPFQLSGPIDDVPETATIEIPFTIIEPQLSLGRITLSPAQFQAALPEEYRALFKIEDKDSPVLLPLQEVLQNLPNESLQLRGDQEESILTETFETPFSTKAAEDAARMKGATGPIAKPALPGVEMTPVVEAAVSAAEPAAIPAAKIRSSDPAVRPTRPPLQEPAAPAGRSELQAAFDTDDVLDAKAVVALASQLPGVRACAIVFSDGLSLAGNIPAEFQAEGLCALAPSIVKRINDQVVGASLGQLDGMTLYCTKSPVSLFAHGNICLAALHSAGEIAADVRNRLSCAVRELARMYAQPA